MANSSLDKLAPGVSPTAFESPACPLDRACSDCARQREGTRFKNKNPPAVRGVRKQEDAATAAPNVPPPMTMVSKLRCLPATWIAPLSSASCRVLPEKRPMLSSVKVVCSDVSIGLSPSVQVGRGAVIIVNRKS